MKIFCKDLVNIADQKTYPIDFKTIEVKDNLFVRRLENVEGDITFYYDVADNLQVNYQISGQMICPDAITLEDVIVDFDLSEDEIVTYDIEQDGFYLNGDEELEEVVLSIVLPEAPIKVVKNEKIEYSRGVDWAFVSEEDYESSKKDEIDPRLQKLSELKFEEDD